MWFKNDDKKPEDETDNEHIAMMDLARSMLSDDEFNEMLHLEVDRISAFVSKEQPDNWLPKMVIALHRGPTDNVRKLGLVCFADIPQDHREKCEMMRNLGEEIAKTKQKIVAILFSTEAWMKQMSDKEMAIAMARSGHIPQPSECADKTEGLIVVGRTIDGRNGMSMGKIVRKDASEKGKIVAIRDVRTIEVGGEEKIDSTLLEHFFRGYLKAMQSMMGSGGNLKETRNE